MPEPPQVCYQRAMKRVCVFCGSSAGNSPIYRAIATELGVELARRGHGLVFGGGHVGLMGAVADATLAAGGSAIGVIPEALQARELAHQGLRELHVTADMHTRKAMMAKLSDAFIALPGGLGTFEELFEVATWAQLELHHKPIGILNVNDYYQHLKLWLDHAAAEGFIKPEHHQLLNWSDSVVDLLDALLGARPDGVA